MYATLLSLVLALGQAGAESELPTQPVKSQVLAAIAGERVTVPSPTKFTVLLFLMPDCPIANRYVPEFKRLSNEFHAKVNFVAIYPGGDLKPSEAKQHALDFGLPFPTYVDPKLELIKATGVKISPEAALLDKGGKVVYRGRIDDLYTSHGTRKASVKRRDLAVAISEALNGKPISKPNIAATGCFLPQK